MADRVSGRLHRAVSATAAKDLLAVLLRSEKQTPRRPYCRQRSCRSRWRGREDGPRYALE